jgi:hypothetical protein
MAGCAAPITPRGAAPPAAGPPATPVAPERLPTPDPGVDAALARDYEKALTDQGLRITGLTITDGRSAGGARRAEIVYRTATVGGVEAIRPDVIRILSPGANPRLALDQITVRAVRPDGSLAATVTVTVAELDAWLRGQMADAEFYARWNVGRPP